jgi:hypothetical protein
MKKSQKVPFFYNCILCDYKSTIKKDYTKHLLTIKHFSNENQPKVPKSPKKNHDDNTCQCGKIYKDKSGLWRHKKKCELITETHSNGSSEELVIQLLKQNQELQKSLIELSKEKSVVTNNNNKTFNLQFFLNEECKDALNITDFVSSIKLNLSDLEATGRLGYAEGISKIIMNNLKSLETCKRPIHCSDLKRETIYIKDNNIWEKDNDTDKKLECAIKDIAHENIKQISVWSKENPEHKDSSSKKSDQYLKIVTNAMSGSSHEETYKNMDKIVSNVARGVTIDKYLLV